MICLGRMYKIGRCSGGGEGCGNLRSDMTAFANTGDNDPAVDCTDGLYSFVKSPGKGTLKGLGHRGQSVLEDFERVEGGQNFG